jgi:O-methyltransferase
MLRPILAFFSKDYRESKYGKPLLQLLENIANNLPANNQNEVAREIGAYIFDETMVWFKSLGFLEDPDFINAVGNYREDTVVMTKIWRIWILSTTLASTWEIEGTALDIGTYDGKSIEIALRYCKKILSQELFCLKSMQLYDAFEDPPHESRKQYHSATLHIEVTERLSGLGNIHVHKGLVPEVLDPKSFNSIRWAQIDLNSEIYDAAAFDRILPYLTQGAIVIIDDYGYTRYKRTQEALNRIVISNGLNPIIELPTGQGLYLHGGRSMRYDKATLQ